MNKILKATALALFLFPSVTCAQLVFHQTDRYYFEETLPGHSSGLQTLTLTNPTGFPVSVYANPTIGGAFYKLNDGCGGVTLYAGQSCTVQVAMAPQSVGYQQGFMKYQFYSNGLKDVTAGLYGEAVPQLSAVDFYPPGATLGPSGFGVDATTTIWVGNGGPNQITMTGLTASSPDFRVTSHNCNPIPAYGICGITIAFAAVAIGERHGFVQYSSNITGSPNKIRLVGLGTAQTFQSMKVSDRNAGSPQSSDFPADVFPRAATSTVSTIPAANTNIACGTSTTSGPGGTSSGTTCYSMVGPPVGMGVGGGDRMMRLPHLNDTKEQIRQDQLDKLINCKVADWPGDDHISTKVAGPDPGVISSYQVTASLGTNIIDPKGAYVLDPIHAGTGNRAHQQNDYPGAGLMPLEMLRTYNSQVYEANAFVRQPVGIGWYSGWDRSVTIINSLARVTRGDGSSAALTWNGSAFVPEAGSRGSLVYTSSGLTYTNQHGIKEDFDTAGRLVAIRYPEGLQYTLQYNAGGKLWRVYNPFGRYLEFGYDGENRVANFRDPAGQYTSYAYDDRHRLRVVTFPDGSSRQYRYEHPQLAFALTSIVDEAQQTYVAMSYDNQNRATGNTFAGGIGAGTVSYSGASSTYNAPDGVAHSKAYQILGDAVVIQSSTPNCTNCQAISYTYNGSGAIATQTTNGVTSAFVYDGSGRPTTITETANGIVVGGSTLDWHPTYNLPVQSTIQGASVFNRTTYDTYGRIATQGIGSAGAFRTTTYTYHPVGTLATMDGPRTDINDATIFTYDSLANLTSRTDAQGTTTYNSYDAHGRLLLVTHPGGIQSSYTYDLRGRLKTETHGGRTTTYTYNVVGLLRFVTDADGVTTEYLYDDAYRSKGFKRGSETTVHSLDAMGRIWMTEVIDSTGVVRRTKVDLESDGKVRREYTKTGAYREYNYDGKRKLSSIREPSGAWWQFFYDSKGRRNAWKDPLTNVASVSFVSDTNDAVASITDFNGQSTIFGYNPYGELTNVESPYSGSYFANYFPQGESVAYRDAKMQWSWVNFDARARKSARGFNDGQTATYTYSPQHPHHLSSVSDGAAITSRTFDNAGRIMTKRQIAGGRTLDLVFQRHNTSRRIETITYPSGRVLTYQYVDGRVSGVLLNGAALLTNIAYRPFGGVRAWTNGDGSAFNRSFDLDGRITSFSTRFGTRSLTHDPDGNITRIDEIVSGITRTQNFTYDLASQLKTFAGFTNFSGAEARTYDYDPNGNRNAASVNGYPYTYVYAANRLQSMTGVSFTYDAAGNATSRTGISMTNDARGRLANVTTNAGTTQYKYNDFGQRVIKVLPSGDTIIYFYDDGGNLIGEYSPQAQTLKEYVWLEGIPVAVIDGWPGTVGYIWTDHTNTPRQVTVWNGSQAQVVWQWDSGPFGDTAAIGSMTFNFRFPGQYYDAETGMHYNGFRYYDPGTGRYLSADPMGPAGGVNVYGYSANNPLRFIDPNGTALCDLRAAEATMRELQESGQSDLGLPEAPAEFADLHAEHYDATDFNVGQGYYGLYLPPQLGGGLIFLDNYFFNFPMDFGPEAFHLLETYIHELLHHNYYEAGGGTDQGHWYINLVAKQLATQFFKAFSAQKKKYCGCK